MDWLASDSQAAAQFQDPQPSEQAAADPLPDPALWENFLPSTAGLSSPAGPALPFQSPAQGFQSAEAQPQALQQSYLEEEPFMEPPSIPSSQPTSGRYSLRPRSVRTLFFYSLHTLLEHCTACLLLSSISSRFMQNELQ